MWCRIGDDARPKLQAAIADFESHRLQVGLAPCRREANVGGMIRVVLDRNPLWYRKLCAKYPSSRQRNHRKPDTRIRRERIAGVLFQLATKGQSVSRYAPDILQLVRQCYP